MTKTISARRRKPSRGRIEVRVTPGIALTTDEARALYEHVKDMALPNSTYAVVLSAVRKLGAA